VIAQAVAADIFPAVGWVLQQRVSARSRSADARVGVEPLLSAAWYAFAFAAWRVEGGIHRGDILGSLILVGRRVGIRKQVAAEATAFAAAAGTLYACQDAATRGAIDEVQFVRARQGAGPSKQWPVQQGPGTNRLTAGLGAEWLPAWSTASSVKRCAVGAGCTKASWLPHPGGVILVSASNSCPGIGTPFESTW